MSLSRLSFLLAVAVFAPATLPSFHPASTRPLMSVVAEAGSMVPPPAVTVNVTPTPGTGDPVASFTCATSGLGSAEPAAPVCASPEIVIIATG